MTAQTSPAAVPPLPAFASIDDWCRLSGMGRRVVYNKLGTGELRAVKVGTRTLVDVQHGLAYLRSCPPARIRPMHKQPRTRGCPRRGSAAA